MIEIIAISLAIVAAIYISYPFFQSRQKRISFDLNHRAEELEARKAQIYAAIKDIDFDYQMGKLSEEDYQELRSQYKAEAVQLLKQMDQLKRPRGKKHKAKAAQAFCAQCGARVNPNDRFCANCGAPLGVK